MSSTEWGSGYTAGKKATCLDLRAQLAEARAETEDLERITKEYIANPTGWLFDLMVEKFAALNSKGGDGND